MSRKYRLGLMVPNEREKEMYSFIQRGMTLEEVGGAFGLTRERVRQIIKSRFGIDHENNIWRYALTSLPVYLAHKDKQEESKKQREALIHRFFGCHEEIVTHINGEPFSWNKSKRYGYKSRAWCYVNQLRFAENRGIQWGLTFPQWWSIWEASGKYHLRGIKKGCYVMSRYGDCGGYEVGNVNIITQKENFEEGLITCPMEERRRRRMAKRGIIGTPPIATHCMSGHEYTEENTYIHKKYGTRYCRECGRIRERTRYWARKGITLQASA